ncbi:hypothetical protein Dimus_005806, partial [Dionaea muscipula]
HSRIRQRRAVRHWVLPLRIVVVPARFLIAAAAACADCPVCATLQLAGLSNKSITRTPSPLDASSWLPRTIARCHCCIRCARRSHHHTPLPRLRSRERSKTPPRRCSATLSTVGLRARCPRSRAAVRAHARLSSCCQC